MLHCSGITEAAGSSQRGCAYIPVEEIDMHTRRRRSGFGFPARALGTLLVCLGLLVASAAWAERSTGAWYRGDLH